MTKLKVGRGVLTPKINKAAESMLGRTITTEELRLIAYIQFVMVNARKLDITKISDEERGILRTWREQGHIEGGAGGLSVTKQFWDFMCEILFWGYVAFDCED